MSKSGRDSLHRDGCIGGPSLSRTEMGTIVHWNQPPPASFPHATSFIENSSTKLRIRRANLPHPHRLGDDQHWRAPLTVLQGDSIKG